MAKRVSYLDNLQKELGQLKKAAITSTKPKTGKPNPSKEGQYKAALGQAVGALVQGRRYDSKGKQIKK